MAIITACLAIPGVVNYYGHYFVLGNTQQRRCRGRSLNVPTHERMSPEYYMSEDLPDAEVSSQYENVMPGYATFACRTIQPVVASQKTEIQHARRLSPQRVEPLEYYENYYTPPHSPVPGSSNTYSVYEKPNSSITHSRRPSSPTGQEISEVIMHDRWQQNKPRKLPARSSYDVEDMLYMQNCYPEYDLSDARRHQDPYAHLLKPGPLEKLKDRLPEGYVERVRRRANKELLLLADGKEEPTKPLESYVAQREIATLEEYFNRLQTIFQDVFNDIEELDGTKEIGSEGRKARRNVPAQTYYSKY